jgi:hypothetical protein
VREFTLNRGLGSTEETFNEESAPKWLCEGGLAGSTMDRRWFWRGHVMKLEVGESVDTDFTTIKRVA